MGRTAGEEPSSFAVHGIPATPAADGSADAAAPAAAAAPGTEQQPARGPGGRSRAAGAAVPPGPMGSAGHGAAMGSNILQLPEGYTPEDMEATGRVIEESMRGAIRSIRSDLGTEHMDHAARVRQYHMQRRRRRQAAGKAGGAGEAAGQAPSRTQQQPEAGAQPAAGLRRGAPAVETLSPKSDEGDPEQSSDDEEAYNELLAIKTDEMEAARVRLARCVAECGADAKLLQSTDGQCAAYALAYTAGKQQKKRLLAQLRQSLCMDGRWPDITLDQQQEADPVNQPGITSLKFNVQPKAAAAGTVDERTTKAWGQLAKRIAKCGPDVADGDGVAIIEMGQIVMRTTTVAQRMQLLDVLTSALAQGHSLPMAAKALRHGSVGILSTPNVQQQQQQQQQQQPQPPPPPSQQHASTPSFPGQTAGKVAADMATRFYTWLAKFVGKEASVAGQDRGILSQLLQALDSAYTMPSLKALPTAAHVEHALVWLLDVITNKDCSRIKGQVVLLGARMAGGGLALPGDTARSQYPFARSGELLDLQDVVVSLVETWQHSGRPGDNMLLAAALPPLLLAVDADGQQELLRTVGTLVDKGMSVPIIKRALEQHVAKQHGAAEAAAKAGSRGAGATSVATASALPATASNAQALRATNERKKHTEDDAKQLPGRLQSSVPVTRPAVASTAAAEAAASAPAEAEVPAAEPAADPHTVTASQAQRAEQRLPAAAAAADARAADTTAASAEPAAQGPDAPLMRGDPEPQGHQQAPAAAAAVSSGVGSAEQRAGRQAGRPEHAETRHGTAASAPLTTRGAATHADLLQAEEIEMAARAGLLDTRELIKRLEGMPGFEHHHHHHHQPPQLPQQGTSAAAVLPVGKIPLNLEAARAELSRGIRECGASQELLQGRHAQVAIFAVANAPGKRARKFVLQQLLQCLSQDGVWPDFRMESDAVELPDGSSVTALGIVFQPRAGDSAATADELPEPDGNEEGLMEGEAEAKEAWGHLIMCMAKTDEAVADGDGAALRHIMGTLALCHTETEEVLLLQRLTDTLKQGHSLQAAAEHLSNQFGWVIRVANAHLLQLWEQLGLSYFQACTSTSKQAAAARRLPGHTWVRMLEDCLAECGADAALMDDPATGHVARMLEEAAPLEGLCDAVLCVVRLCLRKGGCWPQDLMFSTCNEGMAVLWRYPFGDDGADVLALAGQGQICRGHVSHVHIAAAEGGERSPAYAALDVRVQALPVPGYDAEGYALLRCMAECGASSGLMKQPAAVALARQLAALKTEIETLRLLLRVRTSLTKDGAWPATATNGSNAMGDETPAAGGAGDSWLRAMPDGKLPGGVAEARQMLTLCMEESDIKDYDFLLDTPATNTGATQLANEPSAAARMATLFEYQGCLLQGDNVQLQKPVGISIRDVLAPLKSALPPLGQQPEGKGAADVRNMVTQFRSWLHKYLHSLLRKYLTTHSPDADRDTVTLERLLKVLEVEFIAQALQTLPTVAHVEQGLVCILDILKGTGTAGLDDHKFYLLSELIVGDKLVTQSDRLRRQYPFARQGELLDLQEVFTQLVETWRRAGRHSDNMLLPEALPPLLLAVDAAGQQELLDTARTLLNKGMSVPVIKRALEQRVAKQHSAAEAAAGAGGPGAAAAAEAGARAEAVPSTSVSGLPTSSAQQSARSSAHGRTSQPAPQSAAGDVTTAGAAQGQRKLPASTTPNRKPQGAASQPQRSSATSKQTTAPAHRTAAAAAAATAAAAAADVRSKAPVPQPPSSAGGTSGSDDATLHVTQSGHEREARSTSPAALVPIAVSKGIFTAEEMEEVMNMARDVAEQLGMPRSAVSACMPGDPAERWALAPEGVDASAATSALREHLSFPGPHATRQQADAPAVATHPGAASMAAAAIGGTAASTLASAAAPKAAAPKAAAPGASGVAAKAAALPLQPQPGSTKAAAAVAGRPAAAAAKPSRKRAPAAAAADGAAAVAATVAVAHPAAPQRAGAAAGGGVLLGDGSASSKQGAGSGPEAATAAAPIQQQKDLKVTPLQRRRYPRRELVHLLEAGSADRMSDFPESERDAAPWTSPEHSPWRAAPQTPAAQSRIIAALGSLQAAPAPPAEGSNPGGAGAAAPVQQPQGPAAQGAAQPAAAPAHRQPPAASRQAAPAPRAGGPAVESAGAAQPSQQPQGRTSGGAAQPATAPADRRQVADASKSQPQQAPDDTGSKPAASSPAVAGASAASPHSSRQKQPGDGTKAQPWRPKPERLARGQQALPPPDQTAASATELFAAAQAAKAAKANQPQTQPQSLATEPQPQPAPQPPASPVSDLAAGAGAAQQPLGVAGSGSGSGGGGAMQAQAAAQAAALFAQQRVPKAAASHSSPQKRRGTLKRSQAGSGDARSPSRRPDSAPASSAANPVQGRSATAAQPPQPQQQPQPQPRVQQLRRQPQLPNPPSEPPRPCPSQAPSCAAGTAASTASLQPVRRHSPHPPPASPGPGSVAAVTMAPAAGGTAATTAAASPSTSAADIAASSGSAAKPSAAAAPAQAEGARATAAAGDEANDPFSWLGASAAAFFPVPAADAPDSVLPATRVSPPATAPPAAGPQAPWPAAEPRHQPDGGNVASSVTTAAGWAPAVTASVASPQLAAAPPGRNSTAAAQQPGRQEHRDLHRSLPLLPLSPPPPQQQRGDREPQPQPQGSSSSSVAAQRQGAPELVLAAAVEPPPRSAEATPCADSKAMTPELADTCCCPISHEVMTDPVIAADGFTYDRVSIETWLQRSSNSPMTNEPLPSLALMPNRALRQAIPLMLGASARGFP